MKRKAVLISLCIFIVLVFAACGQQAPVNSGSSTAGTSAQENSGSQTAAATADTSKLIGQNFQYDLNQPVNDGKDVKLVLWTDPEVEPFYTELADKYKQVHPNVNVEIVSQPWEDYWNKLPLALNSGTGPDLYRSHASYINVLSEKSYPLPENIFPIDKIKADFTDIDSILYNGKLYSLPLGSNTGAGIYYNKDMWAKAGLTENDIPKTWDDFIKAGQKLTIKDGSGNVTQYGFSIDHTFENFIVCLNYEKGEWLLKDDGFTWNLDNDTMYQNIQLLKDFKDKYGFMMYTDGDCEDQIGHGQAAMAYQYSWVGGYLNDTYPDLKWGFFVMPTFDGKTAPAYDNNATEWTLGVSSTDEAKRNVSFDILKYYAVEGQIMLKQSIRLSQIPSKVTLLKDPQISQYENLSKIAGISDRLINPGTIPTWEAKQKGLRQAGSDIFINGKDPKSVIQTLQKQLLDDAQKNKVEFKSIERQYQHASDMKN